MPVLSPKYFFLLLLKDNLSLLKILCSGNLRAEACCHHGRTTKHDTCSVTGEVHCDCSFLTLLPPKQILIYANCKVELLEKTKNNKSRTNFSLIPRKESVHAFVLFYMYNNVHGSKRGHTRDQ